jgi:serine/threonine protein phosphatase PrpC
MEDLFLNVCGKTDRGCIRKRNEDNILISHPMVDFEAGYYHGNRVNLSTNGVLMMIADGMGGANAGEVASEIAKGIAEHRWPSAESIEVAPKRYLSNVILEVHSAIGEYSKRHSGLDGMGTTIILGWLVHNMLHVSWVGDSRCYVLSENGEKTSFRPFTDDHSLVWSFVMSGEMTSEQARTDERSNIILQCLGGNSAKPVPDYRCHQIKRGDRLLFCSDGLNSMLADSKIFDILNTDNDTCTTCEALISTAKEAGGYDNISVLISDVVGGVGQKNSGR